jgi:DNA-binding transcriptional regulator/RsmH inhibitor MraZ
MQSGELVVAGQGDYFEVWTPVDWQLQMENLQNVDANEQRFSTLDLSNHAM